MPAGASLVIRGALVVVAGAILVVRGASVVITVLSVLGAGNFVVEAEPSEEVATA